MKVRRFGMQLGGFLVGSFVLVSSSSVPALAQHEQPRALSQHNHDTTPDQKSQASAFVKLVRESTERFREVSVAMSEEYALMFGCVSGPDSGAMGLHYVNLKLVMDGELDPTRPEIVIYEPLPNGRLRLIGADFLVFAADWHAKNPTKGTPELGGQLLHYFESPNRFGLPPFYTLHVWAWKDNPTGMFVNWHSNVSCDAFSGQNP
jgi:hypothetical protein